MFHLAQARDCYIFENKGGIMFPVQIFLSNGQQKQELTKLFSSDNVRLKTYSIIFRRMTVGVTL